MYYLYMTNKNTVSDSVKIAPKVAPVSTSTGGISLTQKLTLLVDLADIDMSALPKQVQLVLCALDGTSSGSATMLDINKYFESSEGVFFWGRSNGDAYEQTPAKITAHYLAKMLGQKEWSNKVGKLALIKVS